MKKRIVSLALALVMVLSLNVDLTTAQAADYTPQFTEAAEMLNAVGLFKGTGTNEDGTPIYDLDKPATRMQGLIMLIRLLGEEEAALAYTGACPFTDVSGNAAKYAAYAYSKGYTTGSTATTFGNGPLKANAFLTFVLRALGYDDKAGDFAYGTAFVTAADMGIIAPGEYADQTNAIYRDACAQIAHNALITCPKGEELVLQDLLVERGVIDGKAAEEAGMFTTHPMFGKADVDAYNAGRTKLMDAKIKAVAKNTKYYGLPADIQWIAEPTTEREFLNNVYCCYLVGDYHLNNIVVHDRENLEKFSAYLWNYKLDMAANNPELLGTIGNGESELGRIERGGEDYFQASFTFRIANAGLTSQEIAQQEKEAMAAAQAIYEELHSNGAIKDGMTELEIAQVYYDYLVSLNVKAGAVGFGAEDRGQNMKYDTAYACLVQKSANCLGKAAAFNVLMHLEDISSQGLFCHVRGVEEGNDHILSYTILDGVEYIVDWGNEMPIYTIEEAEKEIEIFQESLDFVRANK